MGFRVWGFWGLGFGGWGFGFGVLDLGFRVWGFWGLRFGGWGLGFRVWGFSCPVYFACFCFLYLFFWLICYFLKSPKVNHHAPYLALRGKNLSFSYIFFCT